MNELILHLGTNQGSRIRNLDLCQLLINQQIGFVESVSSDYETEAWGNTDQPSFINRALLLQCRLSPEEVLKKIHIIESKLGRIRKIKWGPRIIDIDIIFFGQQIIENPNLKIPHTELTNRNFVLIPLMDICPSFIHPILNKTVKDIYKVSKDTLKVEKIR
ncbi:MAG: 2-amino-4-hydroxy-6-hydroxymethyldihydropteridine diphosphokinase [Saprospiraceae bacterium]|nr:2-amino-4-hydroxy-6-hydroxymethyldihydropteridine diphosphokinase [Bacteroidia bacterium]NNL92707.1 2-amino-4-hydroxy-6-hydroxymethyldihydropteridine diphosphokinase [Saprospiraceae bacterium]